MGLQLPFGCGGAVLHAMLPARFSTCSALPAREIRSHCAPGAAGQTLLPSVAKLCPAVTPMRPHLTIPIVYEPR